MNVLSNFLDFINILIFDIPVSLQIIVIKLFVIKIFLQISRLK